MNAQSANYSDLWKAIIRPERDQYEISELGKRAFSRTDLLIKNNFGFNLHCSHYEPLDTQRPAVQLPCVVYLHGNSSSRIESLPYAYLLLPLNITLFSFDFSGCGLSEGEYISLGWYERNDMACVYEYLKSTGKVSKIALWGRSMGAVTTILYAGRDCRISSIVLDSPFSDLTLLAEELCKEYTKIPKFIMKTAMRFIRKTVKKKAKFDPKDLRPIDYISKCKMPALFIHGSDDDFIRMQHSQLLYDNYGGDDKKLMIIEGTHNGERPSETLDAIAMFFYQTLECSSIPQLDLCCLESVAKLKPFDHVVRNINKKHSTRNLYGNKGHTMDHNDHEFENMMRQSVKIREDITNETSKDLEAFFHMINMHKDSKDIELIINFELAKMESLSVSDKEVLKRVALKSRKNSV